MVEVVSVELLHDKDELVDGLEEELLSLLEDVFLPRDLVGVIAVNHLEVDDRAILTFHQACIEVGPPYVFEVHQREIFVEGNIFLQK